MDFELSEKKKVEELNMVTWKYVSCKWQAWKSSLSICCQWKWNSICETAVEVGFELSFSTWPI